LKRRVEIIAFFSFQIFLQFKSYHPICTLAGFDRTYHSSTLLGGRRRRYY
jgi:hypothetical protein